MKKKEIRNQKLQTRKDKRMSKREPKKKGEKTFNEKEHKEKKKMITEITITAERKIKI